MPTARAPTPSRRDVADDGPGRWPPGGARARAEAATRSSAATRPAKRLQIDIELQPPLRARTVVRRVVDLGDVREVVQAADVVRVVLALAPDPAASRDRVDAVVEVVA